MRDNCPLHTQKRSDKENLPSNDFCLREPGFPGSAGEPGAPSMRKSHMQDIPVQLSFHRQLWTRSLAPTPYLVVQYEAIDDEGLAEASCLAQDTEDFSLRDKKFYQNGTPLYHKLLKKCTDFNKLREGRIVHGHLLKSDFRENLIIQNSVLNLYVKCSSLSEARKQFDSMLSKDMVAWTMMISAYSKEECPQEALLLFTQAVFLGMKPTEFTFSSLLKACGSVGTEEHGIQIHAFCYKCGFDKDVYVGTSLIDMYSRCGYMDRAQRMFDGLVSKNDASWNAMIAGLARKDEGEKALHLFRAMIRKSFRPSQFTLSSIFSSCASTGALEQGKWVHAHMIKLGIKLVNYVGHTMLDMYAKSGSINDAEKVFDKLLEANVVSWNTMLTAYALHGFGEKASICFEDMIQNGIEPNEITFLCVFTACGRARLLGKGNYYFDMMKKKYKLEPKVEHYAAIVDLLGRAGHFDQVEKLIRDMPIEPSAAIWGSLLGACRMYKNVELGAYAAKRVFELDQEDSGAHIILANIYASANRWKDVAEVRKTMRVSGVRKEPACSWVDIGNEVHLFMSNDETHPNKDEIYNLWDEIYSKLKENGYVPDTSQVLLYVDEHEREAKLKYHSEKLALAFAILHTPLGSTIRIKKNIRVCGDCHTSIKFVSKLVSREIILRDTHRFHHFRDGSCTCGDYW